VIRTEDKTEQMATETAADATRRLNVKKQTLDDAYAAPANFLEIDVVNPITHGVGKKRYSDYEVRMKVNDPEAVTSAEVSGTFLLRSTMTHDRTTFASFSTYKTRVSTTKIALQLNVFACPVVHNCGLAKFEVKRGFVCE